MKSSNTKNIAAPNIAAVWEKTLGTDGISFSLLLRKSSSPSKKRCSNDPFFKELVTKYMTKL